MLFIVVDLLISRASISSQHFLQTFRLSENSSHTLHFWNPALHVQSKFSVDQLLYFHQAELQEVVGEGEAEDIETLSSPSESSAESSKAETPESPHPQVQHFLISARLKIHTGNTKISV